MSESRVLVVDADEARGQRLTALLEFVDVSPALVGEVGELNLARLRPDSWMAIVVGRIEDEAAWLRFVSWLRNDPLHPPLILLPEHHHDGARRFGVHEAHCWPLDLPLRHAQMSELLQRAGLKQLVEGDQRNAPVDGPTGNSPATLRLRRAIEQVAPHDTTVLLLGESGSGKEVAARSIHLRSSRRNGPFVAINCGAIPPDLLESELFGHEKGAFTGALSARKGRFEMAEGGTLLLDEIGDMSLPMQVKLLRVLQERCFERVGGSQTIECNVRIIAATHRNLEQRIAENLFREDLFYRLNVFPIEMPSLRERSQDLPAIIDALAAQLERVGRGRVRLSVTAVMALQRYPWPGNVRELANLLERLAVLHPNAEVGVEDLPLRYRAGVPGPGLESPLAEPSSADVIRLSEPAPDPSDPLPPEGVDLKEHMAQIERALICSALQRADGVVVRAAGFLGLRRTTLSEKLRRYGLEREAVDLS